MDWSEYKENIRQRFLKAETGQLIGGIIGLTVAGFFILLFTGMVLVDVFRAAPILPWVIIALIILKYREPILKFFRINSEKDDRSS